MEKSPIKDKDSIIFSICSKSFLDFAKKVLVSFKYVSELAYNTAP